MTDQSGATDANANANADAAAAAATAAAAAAAANADNQNGGAKPEDKGSSEGNKQVDPFAALEADTRTWFEKKHGKDPLKAVQQAYALDKALGKSIVLPDENSTDEEKKAFFTKIGVPENVDGYGFNVPTNLPPELPYDGERAKAFAEVCREAGIPKAAANKLHDWYTSTIVNDFTGQADGLKESLKETIKTETGKLEREWGPRDGQTFQANVEFADRFFTSVDESGELKNAIQKAGWLGPKGEILNAALATTFAKAGRALYQEDGKIVGNATDLVNPFLKGPQFNLTAASQLVKNDPAKAKAFALAAGRNPAEFGLE